MTHRFVLPALVLLVFGCEQLKLASKARPKTAAEYCERLRKNFAGETACAPITDGGALTLMRAVEAASVRKTVDGKAVDVAFVTYLDAAPAKQPQTFGDLLTVFGRQLAATSMLEATNEKARVSVWVVRGEISADGFDKLKADVVGLEPG